LLGDRAGAEVSASQRLANSYEISGKVNWACENDGRPATHPVKKVIGLTDELIIAVATWRAKQKPIPNVSEAIRRLVKLGLKAKKMTSPLTAAEREMRDEELRSAKRTDARAALADQAARITAFNDNRKRLKAARLAREAKGE
jgi:hypothetical protein